MVKFNSSRKSNKSKKTIRKLTAPEAVKHNKPKMVFDKCFMRGRYIISVFFVFLGFSGRQNGHIRTMQRASM